MFEWFNSLDDLGRSIFIVASAFTVFMIVQIILMIIGFGLDSTFDGVDDIDGVVDSINDTNVLEIFGLKIISIRAIVAFLSIGGWTSLIFYERNKVVAIIIGVLAGLGAMFLVSYIMKKAMQLQSEGNIDIENTIGKKGSCYLTIPKSGKGTGKVNVLIQERYVEYEAITNDLEDIKTGESVMVVGVLNEQLVVSKLK